MQVPGTCMNPMHHQHQRAVTPDARRMWHSEGILALHWCGYKLNARAQRCDWLLRWLARVRRTRNSQACTSALPINARSPLRSVAIGRDALGLSTAAVLHRFTADWRCYDKRQTRQQSICPTKEVTGLQAEEYLDSWAMIMTEGEFKFAFALFEKGERIRCFKASIIWSLVCVYCEEIRLKRRRAVKDL